jgi:Trypsin-co-occurring domain 2
MITLLDWLEVRRLMNMNDEQPSLGQLIWMVRRELEWVQAVDADHLLRFDVGTVELDVDIEVSRATAGKAGLDLKVMGVGGSAGGSRQTTRGAISRVHVVLTPRDVRIVDGKVTVFDLDTEPPPRRAEMGMPVDVTRDKPAGDHGGGAADWGTEAHLPSRDRH